ncbi:MAG: hypothetical protein IPO52_10155 [Gemmatimonadetes bacterium]|nr:hypothetical protein [Gemmatimonadota bacterium]
MARERTRPHGDSHASKGEVAEIHPRHPIVSDSAHVNPLGPAVALREELGGDRPPRVEAALQFAGPPPGNDARDRAIRADDGRSMDPAIIHLKRVAGANAHGADQLELARSAALATNTAYELPTRIEIDDTRPVAHHDCAIREYDGVMATVSAELAGRIVVEATNVPELWSNAEGHRELAPRRRGDNSHAGAIAGHDALGIEDARRHIEENDDCGRDNFHRWQALGAGFRASMARVQWETAPENRFTETYTEFGPYR